jgi:hypothetical protein
MKTKGKSFSVFIYEGITYYFLIDILEKKSYLFDVTYVHFKKMKLEDFIEKWKESLLYPEDIIDVAVYK